jgi:hypothetical protein
MLGGTVEVLRLIRDLSIILLAVETIVIGVLVLVLVWNLWKLVGIVRRHMDTLVTSANGILGSVKEGADTVVDTAQDAKTTVTYVGDRAVLPIVELYSAVNGASRFARAIFRPKPRFDPRHESDERRRED